MSIVGYRKCANCGKEVPLYHRKRLTHKNVFCNRKCETEYKKKYNVFTEDKNTECPICHKMFHLKNYMKKDGSVHCCSKECDIIRRSIVMKGKRNHQYGLKGKLNASWKSDEKITNYGYKKERVPDHPFKDCDGFVFEHRLLAEKYLATDDQLVEINGKKYLSKSYTVHHLDENKLNNDLSNLIIMTKGAHSYYHGKSRNKDIDLIPVILTKTLDEM